MSLVNLSHVCSHLQNATAARLGLTSIPYTRLHLSLSLLLQKQGFLSQVKLGGPSPPASCFPPGTQRERPSFISRSQELDESHEMSPDLRRWKNRQQLEKDGWDSVAANFFLKHQGKSNEDLRTEGLTEAEIRLVESHAEMMSNARADVEKWMPNPEEAYAEAEAEARPKSEEESQRLKHRVNRARTMLANTRLKSTLLRTGFSLETLKHFAGNENSLRTERDLQRDGVTLTAMGLDIPNQPWAGNLSSESHAESDPDPDGLDVEGVVTQANRASRRLWLGLKYWDGEPVLRKARMLSKPTKRIWLDSREMGGLTRGKGAFKEQIKPLTQVGEIMVVSTDRGIMEVREAAERKVGGMVLCRIW